MKTMKAITTNGFIAIFLGGCTVTPIKNEDVKLKKYYGKASWYGSGARTANGERFNPSGLSVAHKHYAFGTKLKLTNEKINRSVVVVVNDRGPFIKGRELDVSEGGARALGFKQHGTANLLIEVLKK